MAARNFGRVNVSVTASTGGLTRGLGNASKQVRGFASQTQSLGGTLTNAVANFVGLGRGATAAAIGVHALSFAIKTLLGPLLIVTSLVSLFSRFGQTAADLDRVGKAARRFGITTDTFQALEGVASEAGVSIERVNIMFGYLSRQVGMLTQGNKTAQAAFASLGLTLQDLAGLSPEEQFELISQRIQALPTQAQRAAAAMQIFGEAGAEGLNLIAAAATGAVADMRKLQQQLGVSLTTEQVAGIEMMNDALARTSLVFQGFINQFLAELAPSVAAAANLFVKFFAENTSGFNMAQTLGQSFAGTIRGIAAAVTFLYGVFQVLSSFVGVFVTGALKAFEGITWAIEKMIGAMASVAENLPGMDLGLASGLRAAESALGQLSQGAGSEAAVWGEAAAENFAKGVENMRNPLADFDQELASVKTQMQQAGEVAGAAVGEVAAESLSTTIRASTQALKAIVVGSSEGEAFRNSLLRGADPRMVDDRNEERTADATERTADGVADLAATLREQVQLAAITV